MIPGLVPRSRYSQFPCCLYLFLLLPPLGFVIFPFPFSLSFFFSLVTEVKDRVKASVCRQIDNILKT